MPESDHSLNHGHSTDIVTGLPIQEKARDGKEKKLAGLRERQLQHEAVVDDFRSEKGQLALEKIHQALDRRVLELIEEDSTAKALMDILRSIGGEILATREITKQVETLQRLINES